MHNSYFSQVSPMHITMMTPFVVACKYSNTKHHKLCFNGKMEQPRKSLYANVLQCLQGNIPLSLSLLLSVC